MENEIKQISIEDAKKKFDEKVAFFFDIRDPQSFEQGHIPGAIHVTEEKAGEILSSWDKEKEIIIYCYHGNTSYGAAGYFMENGFLNVSSMEGGFETWRQTNPIQ